MGFSKNPSLDP